MTKIAVLDDWQGVARTSADWSALEARAKVVFFPDACTARGIPVCATTAPACTSEKP
jgi:hypothetical protein